MNFAWNIPFLGIFFYKLNSYSPHSKIVVTADDKLFKISDERITISEIKFKIMIFDSHVVIKPYLNIGITVLQCNTIPHISFMIFGSSFIRGICKV